MLEDVCLEREKTIRLPEHEIILSFVNDSGAVKFEDWWFQTGKEAFDDYCKENAKLYGG